MIRSDDVISDQSTPCIAEPRLIACIYVSVVQLVGKNCSCRDLHSLG
jgi:hypothetical protein